MTRHTLQSTPLHQNQNRKPKLIKIALLTLWTAITLMLFLAPTTWFSGIPWQKVDKEGHAILFLIGTIILYKSTDIRSTIAIMLALTFGLELLQVLSPQRTISNQDIGANLLGVFIGLGVIWGTNMGKNKNY